MDSAVKRPWYRLHWVTCFVTVIVVVALVYHQRDPQRGEAVWTTVGGNMKYGDLMFGWPYVYVNGADFGGITFWSTWHYPSFTINALCCLLLTVCTGVVIDAFLRNPTPWQFTLGFLMTAVLITGMLLGLAVQQALISDLLGGRDTLLVSWADVTNPFRWPVLFALACTIYSLGWLAMALLRRAYSAVRR